MSRYGGRPDEPEDGAPTRLRDDPTSSARARKDLFNAAGAAPDYDAAAGLLALQAALGMTAKVAAVGSSAASTTASIASSAAKGALAFKLAVAGGISAVALGGAVLLVSPSRDVAPQAQRASAAPRAVGPQRAQPIDNTAGAHVRSAPAMTTVEAQPQARPKARVNREPRDQAAAEIAQLARIKAMLDRSPAAALRLAEQGHREVSEGYLHHEREGLAIIALHALGRRDEARVRAQRYLTRYPHSSLSERVRALEGEGSEP